jgi:hypothetical protein
MVGRIRQPADLPALVVTLKSESRITVKSLAQVETVAPMFYGPERLTRDSEYSSEKIQSSPSIRATFK